MRLRTLALRAALFTTAATAPLSALLADDDAGEPIVVSGQREQEVADVSKTGTPLRDLPAAVSVVPAELLEDQDVRGLDAALNNASAVAPQFGGGYGFADNYVIRGLPMRFLRDGLPDGATFNGYKRTLADVAAIEVLKGPGSAIFGRGEAGGSVNVVTRRPADQLSFDGSASYGRFDTWSATGVLGGPVFGDTAAQVIGNYEHSDGFRGLSRRFVDILPMVETDLGDHHLSLNYDHREQRLTVDNYGTPFTVAGTLADVDRTARFYSPFNFTEQNIDRVTLSDRYEARPDLTLRAAVIVDQRDISFARNGGGNALNAAGVMTGRNGRTQVDDAQYLTGLFEAVWSPVTGPLKHTILLGAEYSTIDIDTVRRNYNLPDAAVVNGAAVLTDPATVPSVTTLSFDRAIAADTLSLYGQDQIAFGQFQLRGGIRLDGVKVVDEGLFGTAAARIAGTNDLLSYQVGGVWQPSDRISLYAGYARGKYIAINTEAGNLSSNFAKRAAPVPESSNQIEVGFKAEPIPGMLSVNGALFETKRRDFFVTLVTGADPVQEGRQRSRGAEMDFVFTPMTGLSLTGNAAYVDATNLSTALVTVTGIAASQSSYGKRLAATPRWSGNLWANYEVQSGALEGLTLGAGATFKSATYVDALELLKVPGYTVLRATIGYDFGPVEAQLTVANLTDRTYYTVPTFSGALPGEPRSVQLTLRTKI